jgi:CxxC motif-containing protein (DUF1111 family)
MRSLRLVLSIVLGAAVALNTGPVRSADAPAAFDDLSNGVTDQATFDADRAIFDEIEGITDGLGPLYNAQSCRECHQNPISGGASQVTELRVGHHDHGGRFESPKIPIARGAVLITDRSLVNDRAICPNKDFPDAEIQERVPDSENVRVPRISLALLGDGFVEALGDQALLDLAKQQCRTTRHRICGQALRVPVLEAPGETAIGRFGWKDQHASLLSFAADAYLNEMGITNPLLHDEVTTICNTASEPNSAVGASGLSDIDHFARFLRATKAPPRDQQLAATPKAMHGAQVFEQIGCANCHVATLTTAAAGTPINGGKLTVPEPLGARVFHPYSDFLLHDVGTGDGIVMVWSEHYGRDMYQTKWHDLSTDAAFKTQNRMRTAPLWGLRLRPRMMHDGASLTLADAIGRHRGEAAQEAQRFRALNPSARDALEEFLRSL